MRTSLTARSLAGGLRAARARVPRVVSRCPVGSSGTAAAAARWTRPGAPLPRARVLARAELKSGGEGRFVRPVEDKSPRADDDIYWDPADLEDEPPAMQFDFDDDEEEEEEDDDWFFVPEGAMKTSRTRRRTSSSSARTTTTTRVLASPRVSSISKPPAAAATTSRRIARGTEAIGAARERTLRRTRGIRTRAEEAAKRRNSPLSRWRNSARGRRTRFVCSRWECRELLRRLDDEKAAVESFNARRKAENARRTHKRLSIVAGTFARRKILSPSGLDTRPMMGMVRGARRSI